MIIAGIIAFVIYTLVVIKDIDLVRYEEDLLGIEISEYVETSEGKVGVDYARVELVAKQGCETKILMYCYIWYCDYGENDDIEYKTIDDNWYVYIPEHE